MPNKPAINRLDTKFLSPTPLSTRSQLALHFQPAIRSPFNLEVCLNLSTNIADNITDSFCLVDFIIEAEATATFHAELARTIESSTGTQDTKTVTVSALIPII